MSFKKMHHGGFKGKLQISNRKGSDENMIGKGCTCINTFTLPFVQKDVKAICISYAQNKKVLFEKKLEDCTFSDGKVSVRLTQEDTLKFDSFKIIQIQLKVKLNGDVVVKSKIIETITDDILCEGVI